MRQESAFDIKAKSPAEAYGLMQLTPETASRYKVPGITVNFKNDVHSLYRPEINIFLGANLLKDLRKKFNNKFILPAASYNAGSKRVMRWIKERKGGGPAQFIEMIPFAETQKYVKLVTRNYVIYKQLTENKPFKFPEHIFKDL
jgi:soluble lytic murein transglycosylase